jgi:hypothetical protein
MSKEWGIPIWCFMHTLAAKIKPDYYHKVKEEVLNHIKLICASLPCPDCAQHATTYMNAITIHNVPTQPAFVKMLWEFHNSVNTRIGKQTFSFQSLEIYKRVNFYFMFNAFIRAFGKPLNNPRLLLDSMSRTRQINVLKSWIIRNKQYLIT